MRLLCGVAMMLAVGAGAQTATTSAANGTVTGRLTFAETQLPARFADIVLVRKPAPEEVQNDSTHAPRVAPKGPGKLLSIVGRSGFDGSYVIADVPSGDYFAIARMQGYVVPIVMPLTEDDTGSLDKLAAQLTVVHVEANRVATADLTLQRGGVIAGRILYDDGSPVIGRSVWAAPPQGNLLGEIDYYPLADALSHNPSPDTLNASGRDSFSSSTDDQGRYRIAGLPPGNYLVATMLVTGGAYRTTEGLGTQPVSGRMGAGVPSLTVYQPDTLRKAKAKVFEIHAGEEVRDADIKVALNGLHSIRGAAMAKEDKHIPKLARAWLVEDGADPSSGRYTTLENDGSFRFDYVPAGTYTVSAAGDDMEFVPPTPEEAAAGKGWRTNYIHRFPPVKVTVIVSEEDVTVDDLLLVETKPKPEAQNGPE